MCKDCEEGKRKAAEEEARRLRSPGPRYTSLTSTPKSKGTCPKSEGGPITMRCPTVFLRPKSKGTPPGASSGRHLIPRVSPVSGRNSYGGRNTSTPTTGTYRRTCNTSFTGSVTSVKSRTTTTRVTSSQSFRQSGTDDEPCYMEDPCLEEDPCAEVDPCAEEDPCVEVDPCAEFDPCAEVDPCAEEYPCAEEDPCAEVDPCAEDPCADYNTSVMMAKLDDLETRFKQLDARDREQKFVAALQTFYSDAFCPETATELDPILCRLAELNRRFFELTNLMKAGPYSAVWNLPLNRRPAFVIKEIRRKIKCYDEQLKQFANDDLDEIFQQLETEKGVNC